MDGGQSGSWAEVFAIEPLDGLKRHEEIDGARASALLGHIEETGIWTTPLLVDECGGVILDGHHRFWCADALGLEWVPTFRVSHDSGRLALSSWRAEVVVTRDMVVEAARSGRLLPKKTSRHVYSGPLPACSIPIDVLRRRLAA